jgi:hypothetical protein
MSRLGKKPIPVSDKVKVSIQGSLVSVTGPLGQLSRTLPEGLTGPLRKRGFGLGPSGRQHAAAVSAWDVPKTAFKYGGRVLDRVHKRIEDRRRGVSRDD